MKITKRFLTKLKCCQTGILKFLNTPELHDINFEDIIEIISDDMLFNGDLDYLLSKYKKHNIKRLIFNGILYTFDENCNIIDKKHYLTGEIIYTYTYDNNNNSNPISFNLRS